MDIQITKNSPAKIEQEVLEKFVYGTFHWKGLTPSQQMAMARELLHRRQASKELQGMLYAD